MNYTILYVTGFVFLSLIADIQPFYFQKKPILTAQEVEIIEMLCNGYTQKEMASVLNVSHSTIRKNCANLYKKIGAKSSSEAVFIAFRENLI